MCSQVGPTLGQRRLPGLPHDGEGAAQLQALPTQVHHNDAMTSESRASLTLVESYRLWLLKKPHCEYQRIYPSVRDQLLRYSGSLTRVHLGRRWAYSHTILPVRIHAFQILSAVSSWSATRRRKLIPPSSLEKRSVLRRCVSTLAALGCAVDRWRSGTVA